MRMYRDMRRDEGTADKLARARELGEAGRTTHFLVEAGELEQAIVDALAPSADDWGEIERCLRRVVLGAGAAFAAERGGAAAGPHLDGALAVLSRLPRERLPERLTVRAPEGYVHYALDPEGYAAAAARYREEVGAERAALGVVVGLRTIGTSLSGVVAAALGCTRTLTIRPRGSPGERRVVTTPALVRHLLRGLEEGGEVLVVDEGPGATGETFEVVAAWLRGLGIPDRRVVLFPSRAWGMPMADPERHQWFERARKFAPPSDGDRLERVAGALGLRLTDNLSSGRWREVIPGAGDEPAGIGRERVKFRAADDQGRGFLVRYAGLAGWGDAVAERAAALSGAGLGPRPRGQRDGFLACAWVDGQPVSRETARSDPGFFRDMQAYLVGRAALFRTGRTARHAAVARVLRGNGTEALGPNPPGLGDAVARLEQLPEREAVIADARLQPREWIHSPDGYRKVDALDHGDGIWFPGPTDAAWDLAGAAVEFDLPDPALGELADRCARATRESETELRAAVRAYRPAYAAVALGEAALAAREASSEPEQQRLAREVDRYRHALQQALLATA